jgi:hypothetical protein
MPQTGTVQGPIDVDSIPAAAKTQLMDDELLACVRGDVYTDVEETLIEVGRHRP